MNIPTATSSDRMLNGLLRRAYQAFFVPRPPVFFEADWYSEQYPDVAASGIDPWTHFHFHGRYEGRLANWRHLDSWFREATFQRVLQEFKRRSDGLAYRDRQYFAWFLARRMAWNGQWHDVLALKPHFAFFKSRRLQRNPGFKHMPAVLFVDALQKTGAENEARRALDWLKAEIGQSIDMVLLEANQLHSFSDQGLRSGEWLSVVNRIFSGRGLLPVRFDSDARPDLDRLTSSRVDCRNANAYNRPLISVLMAAFNAEDTIGQAIRSVLAQTWENLELIVVDDGSSDATAQHVAEFAKNDDRVRLLQSDRRGGPYAARNEALAVARGEFITLHDADDWSHSQKIELQAHALLTEPSLVATYTDWVRVSGDLAFGTWKMPSSWLGWCHRNTSSFMFRRAVHERLGFWDEVKCNGDVEFVDRVLAAYGASRIRSVLPGTPLAFGRLDDDSLTQQEQTHVMSSLKGLRHDYALAYSAWHSAAGYAQDLYMPKAPRQRPFPVPAPILPS